jgi:hypothetical protein
VPRAGTGGACLARLVRSSVSVRASRGRPGDFARASCLASNGTGFGGGAICDTTGRAIIERAGGAAVGEAARAPRTLVLAGATGAAPITGAVLSSLVETATAIFETGSELVKARVGTAVTAPCTP